MEQFTWEYGLAREGSAEDGLSHAGRIGDHGFGIRHRDNRPCVPVGAVVYEKRSFYSAVSATSNG